MTSDEIKRMQRALNALANVLKVDGIMGPYCIAENRI